MAEHCHDLVRAASSFRQTSPSCLAQPMRLTLERQPGSSDRITEPEAIATDREWAAVIGVDNGYAGPVADGENAQQVSVERDCQLPTGLLLHEPNRSFTHIGPCHPMHIASTLTGIKHQRECNALLRAG